MTTKRTSFKKRILIPIITVFAVSILIISFINYRMLEAAVKTKTNENLDMFTDSIATHISHLNIILNTTKQTLNEKHIAIAKSIVYILENPSADMSPEALQNIAGPLDMLELSIADADGILIASNDEKYIGFDYKAHETTKVYMSLTDGTRTELWEEPRLSMYAGDRHAGINHYTGVSRGKGKGFIQLGFNAGVLGKLQDEINIQGAIEGTTLGDNGYGFVLSDGLVLAHPNRDRIGADASGESWYQTVSSGNGFAWLVINGTKYYAGYKNTDGNTIIGLVPYTDYHKELNQTLLSTVIFLFLSIVVMIIVVYFILGRLVVPIKRLSDGLGEIAKGDLDARITGDYNDEFGLIKDAINAMTVNLSSYMRDKLEAERVANEAKLSGERAEAAREAAENELTQNKISIMLSQIQPHFLYNALTAIQELCYIDPDAAGSAVGEFSRYLRGNLDSLSIAHPILFEKELSHVENYLSLEKTRFGPKLTVVYNISVRDFNIPALTLQPVVENAVRHGLTKREEGGTVTVTTAETENGYTITVTDDGVGFDASIPKRDGRSHVGMENVRNRLQAMCGGELTIRSEPGVGTTTVITIPKTHKDAGAF